MQLPLHDLVHELLCVTDLLGVLPLVRLLEGAPGMVLGPLEVLHSPVEARDDHVIVRQASKAVEQVSFDPRDQLVVGVLPQPSLQLSTRDLHLSAVVLGARQGGEPQVGDLGLGGGQQEAGVEPKDQVLLLLDGELPLASLLVDRRQDPERLFSTGIGGVVEDQVLQDLGREI